MKAANRILVVTGAGSGIGREVALEALRRGARVAACDINPESLAETARIILDGMEADAYRVIVGGDAKLMDRLYRLSPSRAAGFIARQMKDLLPT